MNAPMHTTARAALLEAAADDLVDVLVVAGAQIAANDFVVLARGLPGGAHRVAVLTRAALAADLTTRGAGAAATVLATKPPAPAGRVWLVIEPACGCLWLRSVPYRRDGLAPRLTSTTVGRA